MRHRRLAHFIRFNLRIVIWKKTDPSGSTVQGVGGAKIVGSNVARCMDVCLL